MALSKSALEKNRLKVLRKIEFIVNSGSCAAAFKRAGLPTPFELVSGGKVTLSSRMALSDSSYNSVLDIPNSTRVEARDSQVPAFTLRNNRTGTAIIVFGADAFDASYLDEAVPHEIIHAASIGKMGGRWFGWLKEILGIGHDLGKYDAYADIIANCKDH